jgi:hypothetical protein
MRFAEGEIGGDKFGGTLAEPLDQVEEQLAARPWTDKISSVQSAGAKGRTS